MKIKKMFNDELNHLAENGVLPLKGKISEEGVKALNDELNKSIEFAHTGENLDNEASLNAHYKNNVRKKGEELSYRNKYKFYYMTKKEYREYADLIAHSTPSSYYTIDTSITDKDKVDSIAEGFPRMDFYDTQLIDYNLVNYYNNKPMIVILTRGSRYSTSFILCLVEKESRIPITMFPISYRRYFSIIEKLLS